MSKQHPKQFKNDVIIIKSFGVNPKANNVNYLFLTSSLFLI